MPSSLTLKGLSVLPVLPLLACLTSCGDRAERPNPAVSHPEAARFAPVPRPHVPPPSQPCAHDGSRLCNSDSEVATVIRGYDAALTAANLKLCWLGVFHAYPPCRPD